MIKTHDEYCINSDSDSSESPESSSDSGNELKVNDQTLNHGDDFDDVSLEWIKWFGSKYNCH